MGEVSHIEIMLHSEIDYQEMQHYNATRPSTNLQDTPSSLASSPILRNISPPILRNISPPLSPYSPIESRDDHYQEELSPIIYSQRYTSPDRSPSCFCTPNGGGVIESPESNYKQRARSTKRVSFSTKDEVHQDVLEMDDDEFERTARFVLEFLDTQTQRRRRRKRQLGFENQVQQRNLNDSPSSVDSSEASGCGERCFSSEVLARLFRSSSSSLERDEVAKQRSREAMIEKADDNDPQRNKIRKFRKDLNSRLNSLPLFPDTNRDAEQLEMDMLVRDVAERMKQYGGGDDDNDGLTHILGQKLRQIEEKAMAVSPRNVIVIDKDEDEKSIVTEKTNNIKPDTRDENEQLRDNTNAAPEPQSEQQRTPITLQPQPSQDNTKAALQPQSEQERTYTTLHPQLPQFKQKIKSVESQPQLSSIFPTSSTPSKKNIRKIKTVTRLSIARQKLMDELMIVNEILSKTKDEDELKETYEEQLFYLRDKISALTTVMTTTDDSKREGPSSPDKPEFVEVEISRDDTFINNDQENKCEQNIFGTNVDSIEKKEVAVAQLSIARQKIMDEICMMHDLLSKTKKEDDKEDYRNQLLYLREKLTDLTSTMTPTSPISQQKEPSSALLIVEEVDSNDDGDNGEHDVEFVDVELGRDENVNENRPGNDEGKESLPEDGDGCINREKKITMGEFCDRDKNLDGYVEANAVLLSRSSSAAEDEIFLNKNSLSAAMVRFIFVSCLYLL
uniref:Uncharacterized protein n=1 Tax=Ditylum brightwellii TaxID=49249 RepID=A0A7S2EMK5_9STRA|mmetsp:Transcript_36503/g.54514  ORF Transcript_36503/g.54514 Transcript_36503/m.54514 type:complete len:732 (+) Transcript_36503:94-2289(+)